MHPVSKRKPPIPIKLKHASWRMREGPTKAEIVLWEELRLKRLGGYKFRQQHVIDRYIADFYCHQTKLVIEVDGSSHDHRKTEDRLRDAYMESLGYTVIRFTNEEVLSGLEKVKAEILSLLDSSSIPNGKDS